MVLHENDNPRWLCGCDLFIISSNNHSIYRRSINYLKKEENIMTILFIIHAIITLLSGCLAVYAIKDGIDDIYIFFFILTFFTNLAALIYLKTIAQITERVVMHEIIRRKSGRKKE